MDLMDEGMDEWVRYELGASENRSELRHQTCPMSNSSAIPTKCIARRFVAFRRSVRPPLAMLRLQRRNSRFGWLGSWLE